MSPWGNWWEGIVDAIKERGGDGDFPSYGDGGGGVGAPSTVDLGHGVIAVLDAEGNIVDIRSAPSGPGPGPLPRTQFPSEAALQEAQAGYYGAQAGLLGAQTETEQGAAGRAQQELDRFDRELDASIQQNQAELVEKRRQFDVSVGLEREKLAAEIKMLERRLNNDLAIARLDSRTRLSIGRMEAATARRGQTLAARTARRGQDIALRGQDIGREQFAAGLGARRAEFATNILGRDPTRQAMFVLGESGGTTPAELAMSQFPRMRVPGVRSMARGGGVSLRNSPVAVRVGERGPEIVLVDKSRMDVIPEVASAQYGGAFNLNRPARQTGAELEAVRGARKTFADTLRRAMEAGPMARFGGLDKMEPVFGVDVEAPSKIAYSFSRKAPAVQRLILSTLGVRGIDAEEAMRRMRAATPEVAYGGMARSR